MTKTYFKKNLFLNILALLFLTYGYAQKTTLKGSAVTSTSTSSLIITGIFDGPLKGALPKGIELYVTKDIADLSIYGFGSANNGGGTDGQEFKFPSVFAKAGDFIYIASEKKDSGGFKSFFGFAPTYVSGAVSINGDDAIELFKDGTVIDVFGDVGVVGVKPKKDYAKDWDYKRGWAYRKNNTGPDGSTFVLNNWTFSGMNALKKATTNATANNSIPIKTYQVSGGGTTDTQAPSIPTNLTASNTTATETVLLWTASTDNIGVTGYQIFKGDAKIGTSTTNTYTVTGLTAKTTYSFTVKAVDAAGNVSGASSADSVTTLEGTATASSSILKARNAADNEIVTVTGVLTVSDQFAGPAYIQDKTAAIAIYDKKVYGKDLFKIGDSITVTGKKVTYKGKIEISKLTKVEKNKAPKIAITPKTITFAEIKNHPSELVKISNPTFSKSGHMLFNSSYELKDASGKGTLYIDNDVELIGLKQPQTCNEITGIVDTYKTNYQLLPRIKSDMTCAGNYIPLGSSVTISKDKTFDVVAWNMDWFGNDKLSPKLCSKCKTDINRQKDSILKILKKLDADVYAVEEVSNAALFKTMIDEMPDYNYVLSKAVSYPSNTDDTQQKVGFIYNKNTVKVVKTKVLLKADDSHYGGDDSILIGYPDEGPAHFFASGRLPFMMTADVTIDGVTKKFNLVVLHARANRGKTNNPKGRYDMRKYDVEVLKDTLDAQYANANLIVLGDYNDDIDETVAAVSPITASSYEKYVKDTKDYTFLTKTLSDGGYHSFVSGVDNMIDQIMVSNEVAPLYINNSVNVGYEFYNSNYTKTTSDHFPISARFNLSKTNLSVKNEIFKSNHTLYPNPVESVINWNKNDNIDQIMIYNILGSKIFSSSHLAKNNVDISMLKQGIYFVQLLKNNQVVFSSKIIKK